MHHPPLQQPRLTGATRPPTAVKKEAPKTRWQGTSDSCQNAALVDPVRASGQSIHAHTMVLPVRASVQKPANDYVRVARAREWPEHPCPHDDSVGVTNAHAWPKHPCPHDSYVRVTRACAWPEHPCRRDDNVLVTRACGSHGDCVRVTSACE